MVKIQEIEVKSVMTKSNLPVADIAAQLHFDTATYFVRLFKKYMAMTPMEYREKDSPEK